MYSLDAETGLKSYRRKKGREELESLSAEAAFEETISDDLLESWDAESQNEVFELRELQAALTASEEGYELVPYRA